MNIFDAAQVTFLLVAVALSLGRTWWLKRQDISVWVLARNTGRRAQQALEIFYLVGLAAWLVLVLLLATGHADVLPARLVRPLFESTPLKIVALLLLGLSLLLHALGLRGLGSSWRVGTSRDHPGALVTHGIYAFSRNPILLGLILYALSVWLTYPNPLLLTTLGVVLATVHVQVRREEAFLSRQHGSAYAAYRKRVGRYVTLVRSP